MSEKLKSLYHLCGLVLKFHKDVPWCGSFFIHCAGHLVRILQSGNSCLQFLETFLNYFIDDFFLLLLLETPVFQMLELLNWSFSFLILKNLFFSARCSQFYLPIFAVIFEISNSFFLFLMVLYSILISFQFHGCNGFSFQKSPFSFIVPIVPS